MANIRMRQCRSISGFTLIELSIVLIIIGLITAGILVGRDLIRAAEIKKIHKDSTTYITALNAFKEKYQCFPGDCPIAEQIFEPDATCPAPNDSPPSNKACDGNGNGFIHASTEPLEAWRQLANAGLIEGVYSGGASSETVTGYKTGFNCPKLLEDKFCWMWANPLASLFSLNVISIIDGNYGNIVLAMMTGDPNLVITERFSIFSQAFALGLLIDQGQSVLTPEEAYRYDLKYDDGNPVYGHILAENMLAIGVNCTTTNDEAAQYDLSKKLRNCGLFYRTAF